MTASTLLFMKHYCNYIVSWRGLLAVVLVSMLYRYRSKPARTKKPIIPGCIKIGLRGESNLDNVEVQDGAKPKVKAIFTYPVKSCRGIELPAAEVTMTGLKYDRQFSFAQLAPVIANPSGKDSALGGDVVSKWTFITQREYPRLALVKTDLWLPDPRRMKRSKSDHNASKRNETEGSGTASVADVPVSSDEEWTGQGGCLVLRFTPGPTQQEVTISLPLNPTVARAKAKQYTYDDMKIWLDRPLSINMTNEIDPSSLQKLRNFLGVENQLGLFRSDANNLRSIHRSLPKDCPDQEFEVGFADAFPVHIVNLASVSALSADTPDGTRIDPQRFRANIIVSRVPAYDEDTWKRITLGRSINHEGLHASPGAYHIACRTARCVLTNVDQETGIQDRKEPFKTLKRTRQVDEGAKPHPCLGLSVMPLFQEGAVKIGDEVEVLERGVHVYEKMLG